MDEMLSFAINLAHEAGDLFRDRFRWSGVPTEKKADHSVVTEADLAADRLITRNIHEMYPGDAILSEELNTDLRSDAESIWVIDLLMGPPITAWACQYGAFPLRA